MMGRHVPGRNAAVVCFALIGTIVAADTEQAKPPAKPRMNFVFMFPDTLRAESFSSYGLPLETSPNLDAFAKTAVRFEQTHALHTQCTPSRVTMLTGRYMHVLGHRTQTHLIQPYEFNYLQTMKDNGYNVQYYGKNDAFSEDSMNLSATQWFSDKGISKANGAHTPFKYPEAGYYSMLAGAGSASGSDTHHNGDYRGVVRANAWMKEWAGGSREQPFVIFLPGMGAHPPYGAPKEFNDKWALDVVKEKIKLRPPYNPTKPDYHSKDKGIPHYRNLTSLDDDVFYKIQATYLGMISYIDWVFGELLKGVREAGLEENTAVFFSSDHGDFGGDFHLIEKWPGGADDILSRVPLYMRVPGASKSAEGFVARAPVSLFDVPHTMCELAGIDVTGDGTGKYGINFGKSLIPQVLHGVEGDMSRYVYAEGGFGFKSEVFPMGSDHVPDDPKGMYYPRALEEMSDGGTGSPKWVMMRNLTHKLVYRPKGTSELYDFMSDPRELNNRWDDPTFRPTRDEMQGKLLEWLVETGDVSPVHRDPRGVPPFPHAASACAVSGAVGPNKLEDTDLTEAYVV